jgi:uncharacterized protein (TIGR00730 family)
MGHVMAERGLYLIYGGGKTGLMGAVANGVLEAGGQVTGVIITSMNTEPLAHTGLTKMEVKSDMHMRKARMYELADGFVALPGGFGTMDELFETITWSQIGNHQKPVGLLNVNNYYIPLLAAMDHAAKEGFVFKEYRDTLFVDFTPGNLLDSMAGYKYSDEVVKKWMRKVG